MNKFEEFMRGYSPMFEGSMCRQCAAGTIGSHGADFCVRCEKSLESLRILRAEFAQSRSTQDGTCT
jgi:hypothetical protein